MQLNKANIIAQLKKDILPLQGFRIMEGATGMDAGLGKIKYAFPNASFPIGAIHEFIYRGQEDETATIGFIAGILTSLMCNSGVSVWISNCQKVFPPALKSFGIDPDKIIFINLSKQKDILWCLEEALKCDGLSAVVGEIKELGFTESRRFQLAVEQSRVTGFILRNNPRNLNINACITRWSVSSLHSIITHGMPGVGYPSLDVELLKVRNGKPGKWHLELSAGKFRHINRIVSIPSEQRRKIV